MKLNENNRSVHTVGIERSAETEQAFSIRADGNAFQILSSAMYSNKIEAIERELVCNAWDVHQVSGKTDVPIEVHLPTWAEPYFEVKDYGTGLSIKDTLTLYSTYFASTKRNSDSEIGGFGIGSKAPFAYVDTFFVESRFGGVRNVFNAHIGKNGAPTIMLVHSTPLEEGEFPGITVRMDVKNGDIPAFEKTAKKIMPLFKNPHVKINTELSPIEYTYQNEFGGCAAPNTHQPGSWALMGNVLYSIPAEVLAEVRVTLGGETKRWDQVVSVSYNMYNSRGFSHILFFKIGEVAPQPNRESLSITPATKATIVQRAKDYVLTAYAEYEKSYAGAVSFKDFFQVCSNFNSGFLFERPLFKGVINTAGSNELASFVLSRVEEFRYNISAFQKYVEPVPPVKVYKSKNYRDEIVLSKKDLSLFGTRFDVMAPACERNASWGTFSDAPKTEHGVCVVLHGDGQKFNSGALNYKWFMKDKLKKKIRVRLVKVPSKLLTEHFKNRMRAYLCNLPKDLLVTVDDIMAMPKPPKDVLIEFGLARDPSVVTTSGAPVTKASDKAYQYGRCSFDRTVGFIKAPGARWSSVSARPDEIVQKLTSSAPPGKCYYVNLSESEAMFQAASQEERQTYQRVLNAANLGTVWWVSKEHAKVLKGVPSFESIHDALKEKIPDLLKTDYAIKDVFIPDDIKHPLELIDDKLRDKLELRALGLHKDLEEFIEVGLRMRYAKNSTAVLSDGDLEGVSVFSLDKTQLHRVNTYDWKKDLDTVRKALRKNPLLKGEGVSYRMTDGYLHVVNQHHLILDALTKEQKKLLNLL